MAFSQIANAESTYDEQKTLGCIKGGSKYVFVSGGSVYQIDNQSFTDLEKRAGQMVEVTGDMKGTRSPFPKFRTNRPVARENDWSDW